MNNDEFQQLVKELKDMEVQLPLHKKALRQRILEERTRRRRTLRERAISVILLQDRAATRTKRVLSIGAVIVVVGILVISLLILLPVPPPGGAKKLIAEAAEQVKEMDPGQVGRITQEYEDLNDSLEDAKNSPDARIAHVAEVRAMIGERTQEEITEEHGSPEVYVSYTDKQDNTVVIALDGESEPLYALNVSQTQTDREAGKAEKRARKDQEKEARKAAKDDAKRDKRILGSGLLQGAQTLLD